jgi:hypothetical protein
MLVKRGSHTDWKRQYKLRHNWTRGSAAVREISVAEKPAIPPLLVQLCGGYIFTADSTDGLRAWAMGGHQLPVAETKLEVEMPAPTSLAVSDDDSVSDIMVIIGYQDGSFRLHKFSKAPYLFHLLYTHPPSSTGLIIAVAFSNPYLVTMTESQKLSMYSFAKLEPDAIIGITDHWLAPRLLASLKSHTVWPPSSLSLRRSTKNIMVSIAYALPTYFSGWSVGLQELHLNYDGSVAESRIASAVGQDFQPLTPTSSSPPSPPSSPINRSNHSNDRSTTKPTSLSYSHPYLLASHPDNTLTLYLVTSSAEKLLIGAGSRLWGHTSSVSGAHVGGRGKAVSVSTRGDELRVWELEGGISSSSSRKRLASGELSVQVRREQKDGCHSPHSSPVANQSAHQTMGLGQSLGQDSPQDFTRGWVGFDDEKVIVLREKGQGSQALVIYDFS